MTTAHRGSRCINASLGSTDAIQVPVSRGLCQQLRAPLQASAAVGGPLDAASTDESLLVAGGGIRNDNALVKSAVRMPRPFWQDVDNRHQDEQRRGQEIQHRNQETNDLLSPCGGAVAVRRRSDVAGLRRLERPIVCASCAPVADEPVPNLPFPTTCPAALPPLYGCPYSWIWPDCAFPALLSRSTTTRSCLMFDHDRRQRRQSSRFDPVRRAGRPSTSRSACGLTTPTLNSSSSLPTIASRSARSKQERS